MLEWFSTYQSAIAGAFDDSISKYFIVRRINEITPLQLVHNR